MSFVLEDSEGARVKVAGEVLPLALIVTLSPLNILPVILLLFTRRPLLSSSCFLAAFVVGVTIVLAAGVLIADAIDHSAGSSDSTWVTVVKFVLGVYLVVAAVRKFRGRPRDGEETSMPKRMEAIAGFSPGKSLGAGLVLGALNPKNLVAGLAAATTISNAALSGGQQVAVIAAYVVVAALGVAVPIMVTLVLGERSHEVLDRWKSWLGRNSATVMSTLFALFGAVLIGQAVAAA